MDGEDDSKKSLGDDYKSFRGWQGVLFLLHFSAALTLGLYAHYNDRDWTTKVYYKHNAWVSNSSKDNCDGGCKIMEVKEEVDGHEVSLAWAAASFSFISGAHHLFAFLSDRKWNSLKYKRFIEGGVVWPRWIDYAFSSGIMLVIIGILFTSPPDLTFIVSLRVLPLS